MSVEQLLRKYREMRDFSVTSEPEGGTETGARKVPLFVVQEHHASHLHHDLRIEAEGVLKSWAVPKGPSTDPKVKRLAMQTEDHPIEYADFHGDIPEGEYGGGHMEIWDHGTYENLLELDVAQSVAAGHVKLSLQGTKLKGAFSLRRIGGGRQWLLLKVKDQ